tara:strand:+ start:3422 stop:4180 length:759 start_codon:yes stop_codon:yes gene_type:complete
MSNNHDYPKDNETANEIQHWITFESHKSNHNLGEDTAATYGQRVGQAKVMCPQNLLSTDSHRYGVISQKLLKGAADIIGADGGIWEKISEGSMNLMQQLVEGAGIPMAQQIGSVLSRTVTNPQEEQYYQAPNFRTFTFAWEFAPTSSSDSKDLGEMIAWFKQQSYPIKEGGGGGGFRYKMPNEWKITHVANQGGEFKGVGKIDKCVLTNINTNFTGAGIMQSFEGGGPAFVNLELNFTETTLKHQDSDVLGY